MDPDDDQLNQGNASPDNQAATPAIDLDAFKNDLLSNITESIDKRWQGWQKSLSTRDQKLEQLSRTLDELKTSTLSETERAQLTERAEQQELAALRAERELWRLTSDYPDEAPLFQRILEAPTAKDQLEILREFKTALAAPKTPAQEPDPKVEPQNNSPVDPNNPPAPPATGSLQKKFEQDPSIVDRILGGARRWRDQDDNS